jgi:hypothetical protein
MAATLLRHSLAIGGLALLVAACTSTDLTPQETAIAASDRGDQKTAVSLTEKDVARLSAPGQCSGTSSRNCGTLALAYSTLAEYQILDGNTAAGESSFARAKDMLGRTRSADRRSATAMVYHDVSEAYWKTGDRARAVVVFKEGRAAGSDGWLMTASAARIADLP